MSGPDFLSEHFAVAEGVSGQDNWIAVNPGQIREALARLRELGFDTLSFLTCVDHLGDGSRPQFAPGAAAGSSDGEARFELVYQLRRVDPENPALIRVRTFLPAADPVVASVADLYPNANWDERETYDMFGIRFQGHPNLTRILMPDDWVGHPLRRDHPVGGEPVDFSEDHEVWDTAPEKA